MKTARMLVFMLLAFVLLAPAQPVFAGPPLPEPRAADGPLDKLGRGFGNFWTGWVECFVGVNNAYRPNKPMRTFLSGGTQGFFRGVVRTLAGAYEFVTFPFPNGEAGYGPIMHPETVYQAYSKSRRKVYRRQWRATEKDYESPRAYV